MSDFDEKPSTSASGLITNFLPENPDEICKRLSLIIRDKQGGNDSEGVDDEIVAKFDESIECKITTSTQHQKIFI